MNRLDFSDILNIDGHNLEDSNQNFEALDAVYKFLSLCPDIDKVIWNKKSDYDLTFTIYTSKPLQLESIDVFVHLKKFMELHVDKYNDKMTNIHISYKKL